MALLQELRDLRYTFLRHLKTEHLFARAFESETTRLGHEARGYGNGWAINVADVGNIHSVRVSERWAQLLEGNLGHERPAQTSGASFEQLLVDFLNESFKTFSKLGISAAQNLIAKRGGDPRSFDQYRHLRDIQEALRSEPALEAVFGRDYSIKPDITVARGRQARAAFGPEISIASLTPFFREAEGSDPAAPLLHAIISCKVTIRNDRVQNVRPEAANALRTRKGRAPHILCFTAEPMPSRMASIGLGTGDIDCLYHCALPELTQALNEAGPATEIVRLNTLINGRRLRDVADLALDLCS